MSCHKNFASDFVMRMIIESEFQYQSKLKKMRLINECVMFALMRNTLCTNFLSCEKLNS